MAFVILIFSGLSNYSLAADTSDTTATVAAPKAETTDPTTTVQAPVTKKTAAQKKLADDKSAQLKSDAIATANTKNENPVINRASTEHRNLENRFSIAFYKPTYILPFYYTGSPYNSVYAGQTPQDESLKKDEVKYQLSFKVPVWSNIFGLPSSIFFAYTQLSYWQLYDRDPFFRETDYEPEVFLANEVNWHLGSNWYLNFINIGAVHQSNGYGGSLERSWNRVYLQTTLSCNNWILTVRPWVVFHDSTYQRQNPNMSDYLGHEQFIVVYKYGNQVVALEARNVVENHARKGAFTLSWSFPITKHLNGYIQGFSGYGQSLIEYNHRTNSVGVGLSLSNWV